VIAIIALLMGILMPALARVRMIAYRMVCGSNLSGIGKAILLYAGDSKEEYPLPGIDKTGILVKNGYVNSWNDASSKGPTWVYGGGTGTGGQATIGSLFYLLVKYEDVAVKQFNCKGDVGVQQFKLSDWSASSITDIVKAWDFGKHPSKYNSYSYHMPFSTNATSAGNPINSSSTPGTPLAADRNPAMDKNASAYLDASGGSAGGAAVDTTLRTPYQRWGDTTPGSYQDPDLLYNAFAHQREGQNVMFNDGHVKFEKQANVGINNDNIWQRWGVAPPLPAGDAGKKIQEVGGIFPVSPGAFQSAAATGGDTYSNLTDVTPNDPSNDALLVNEPQGAGRDS